jgi:hypothetical protein
VRNNKKQTRYELPRFRCVDSSFLLNSLRSSASFVQTCFLQLHGCDWSSASPAFSRCRRTLRRHLSPAEVMDHAPCA